jgi:hypothetical protein
MVDWQVEEYSQDKEEIIISEGILMWWAIRENWLDWAVVGVTTGGERGEERARHVECCRYGTLCNCMSDGVAEMDGDTHWKLQCGDRLLGEAS